VLQASLVALTPIAGAFMEVIVFNASVAYGIKTSAGINVDLAMFVMHLLGATFCQN
jgi:hypothetical protein